MWMWMYDLPLLTLQQLNTYGIMHGHVNVCSLYQTMKKEVNLAYQR